MVTLAGHSGVVTALRFSAGGEYLASADGSDLIVWSVAKGKLLHRFPFGIKKEKTADTLWSGLTDALAKVNFDLLGNSGLTFSNDAKTVAAYSQGMVKLWT